MMEHTEMKSGTVWMIVMMWIGLSIVQAAAGSQADQTLHEARPKAVEVLLAAARGADPFVRANAVEAMENVPDRALPVCELAVGDEQPVVRFAALVTIGKLRAGSMVRVAERMTQDAHPSVRAAAYFAAARCGSSINLTPLAGLLMGEDPDVRANAAMLLGLMGEPSAGQLLAEAGSRPMPRATDVKVALVRCQIAEARVRLGDLEAIDALRAGVYSHYPEVRLLCVGALGELGDAPKLEDALLLIYHNSEDLLEMRLATASALLRHGREVVVKEVLAGEAIVFQAAGMTEPAFRVQAAATLGAIEQARSRIRPRLLASDPAEVIRLFEDPAPSAALVRLMGDPDARVKVAAAAGVLAAQ